jgi:hypothetical protein
MACQVGYVVVLPKKKKKKSTLRNLNKGKFWAK